MDLMVNDNSEVVGGPTGLGKLLQGDESKQHDSRVGLGALQEEWQKI